MALKSRIILMDTNAIIEAHRVKCWSNLFSFFSIITVDECITELGTGDVSASNYVNVDTNKLRESIFVYKVSQKDRINFSLKYDKHDSLDPGERDLIAYALEREDVWLLCSPDKACVRAMNDLNLLDRTISLQELVEKTRIKLLIKLKKQYTKKWLGEFRTNLRLEKLNKEK